MKKALELVMWTLFFSALTGMGLTAGIFCYLGIAELIARLVA